jgi:DNA-binding response OmpR family regulator
MAALVLVVEDEAHVRELVSYTLQGAGYRVGAVDEGESALQEVSRTPPQLIVLDVRLPGIDGWEVCRRVREQSTVPIPITDRTYRRRVARARVRVG